MALRIDDSHANPRRVVDEIEPDVALRISQVVAGLGSNLLADAHLHRGLIRAFDVDEPADIPHIQRPAATGGKDKRASNRGVIHHVVTGRALRVRRPDERQPDDRGRQATFRHDHWMGPPPKLVAPLSPRLRRGKAGYSSRMAKAKKRATRRKKAAASSTGLSVSETQAIDAGSLGDLPRTVEKDGGAVLGRTGIRSEGRPSCWCRCRSIALSQRPISAILPKPTSRS